MHRSFLVLLGFASAVGLSAFASSCASGGSSGSSPSDGGDDSTTDGAPIEGGEGGTSEGGAGPSLTQACSDYVAKYCAQLNTCSPFLLSTQYGDVVTCQTRLGAYCNNIVSAKGNGWTGSGLEACGAAHSKLSCTEFLYDKPEPTACRPSGSIPNGSTCLFDSQCGSGYCRIPAGMQCGACLPRGLTAASCATDNDCDGNLLCLNAACTAPTPMGAVCTAATRCQYGLVCLGGHCIQPGGVGATCDADAGGLDCDSNLGAYCGGTTCAAVTVAMSASLCASPQSVCIASGLCQGGFCVPPIADGQPCDGGGCTIPSTCASGTCNTPSATQCP